MFEAWGRGLYRARRLTLVIALLFAVGAGVWGTGVFGKLDSGNTFTPPNSQSSVESNLAGSRTWSPPTGTRPMRCFSCPAGPTRRAKTHIRR